MTASVQMTYDSRPPLDRSVSALLTASTHPVIRRLDSGARGRTSTTPAEGGRATRCPIGALRQARELQDYESPQLLLGIREGAVLYPSLSFLIRTVVPVSGT